MRVRILFISFDQSEHCSLFVLNSNQKHPFPHTSIYSRTILRRQRWGQTLLIAIVERLKYSGIPISRTLGFPNLPISRTKPCFLGFASLKPYNFTPDFSNPRFLETPDNSNQFLLPWDKLTLDNSNMRKFSNHLVRISITFTPLNKVTLPDKLFSGISKPQICYQPERYNDCFGLHNKRSLIQLFFWSCCCNTSINFVVPLK